tara:strand:- start:20442 stop:20711 length:270 start_codon:yes stop_codon:yes gene_type:complete
MPKHPLQPLITDHALVRYLERVMGLDMNGVRAEIAARVGDGVRLGASAVVSGGFKYTLDSHRVTTVMPSHHEANIPLPKDRPEDEAHDG